MKTRDENYSEEAQAMGLKRKPMLGAVAVAMFMVAFLVAGCGDNPVAPLSDGGTGGITYIKGNGGDPLAAPGAMNVRDVKVKPLDLAGSDSGSAVIGPLGGKITLGSGAFTLEFAVPKGALTSDVLISVVADFSGPLVLVEFGPDGLVFNVPAKLTLKCKDPEGTVKCLYWWNPDLGCWQLMETAKVKDTKVVYNIYHFSKYGITSK